MHDRAQSQRVRYYCNQIKALEIGNRNAASYFGDMARQWERIRQRSATLLRKARP